MGMATARKTRPEALYVFIVVYEAWDMEGATVGPGQGLTKGRSIDYNAQLFL